jgi:SAM-dependent methyltransferase
MQRNDETVASGFHGAFIPAVVENFLQRLTEQGDWVLDMMAGSGTTGRVCTKLGRRYFLSDLNPTAPAIWQADAREDLVSEGPGGLEVRDGPPFQFDLVLLHPPYWDIIEFSDDSRDLSQCGALGHWKYAFVEVVMNAWRHLKPGGYLGLVLGDLWREGETVPLGFIGMDAVLTLPFREEAFTLKSIQVKNIGGNRANAHRKNLLLSRFYRWGAVEFCHEYLFTFRKPR